MTKPAAAGWTPQPGWPDGRGLSALYGSTATRETVRNEQR